MDKTMVVFKGPALDAVMDTMRTINDMWPRVHSLAIAYDPMDNGIKFKVNDGPWTRPFRS